MSSVLLHDFIVEEHVKNALKEGIRNNTTDVSLPETSNTKNPSWLRDTLSKYLNNNWIVLEGDGYDSA